MLEEFDIQKLKKEYPEFFKQVSSELLEFILSEETSSKIAQICLKNKIEEEEKIEKIAYRIVLAMLEQIPMKNLPLILEKGVGLSSETAEKIYTEINQLIFPKIKKPPLIPGIILGLKENPEKPEQKKRE